MLRLLDQDDVAEVYFCGDDVLSIGAMSAIQDAQLRIPDDIGLIGLNDIDMAGWANINLTTIRNPIAAITALSIDLIAGLTEQGDHLPRAHVFDCAIIERGTLRPLRKR